MCRFNPRAREGRDGQEFVDSDGKVYVSIHAPARGATLKYSIRVHKDRMFQSTRPRGARLPYNHGALHDRARFNPRAREGRDCSGHFAEGQRQGFNPRAREGRDKPFVRSRLATPSFNPRAREGRDMIVNDDVLDHWEVSIHAPARGATPFRAGRR